MNESREAREAHPAGDGPSAAREVAREAVKLDTFGGTVHVEWDPDAAATPLGHLAFFAEYLKISGRFDALVADCPLYYTSPNAPSKRDVLGTVLLSVLAGQSRYAHITALRGDGVNPALLGMTKVASEDSVRRGLERIEAEDGTSWLHGHLEDTVRPLLSEPWVLDCDTTSCCSLCHSTAGRCNCEIFASGLVATRGFPRPGSPRMPVPRLAA